jgi:phospholipid/cholesterol/gamma-HCH transport system ATP-binding protein
MNATTAAITVSDLTMAYGSFVLQRGLDFTINQGDIFVIMGGSGCGKSTLLRHMIGLMQPAQGEIWYGKENFWKLDDKDRAAILRKAGVLYQSGALWSSMTLGENIALPLAHYTSLPPKVIDELVSFKLSLVGLAGFESYYPAQLSGGMRKRAALARAIALDPDFLFFDEPSAGLDPINARNLDQLIQELCEGLGATVIIVTHELASIYAIGTNSVFLDGEQKTMLATGDPKMLLKECQEETVVQFLTRGTGKREVRTV